MTTGSRCRRDATSASASPLRAASATRAPAASRATAIAAPMPREAPVTRAVRPSSENGVIAIGDYRRDGARR